MVVATLFLFYQAFKGTSDKLWHAILLTFIPDFTTLVFCCLVCIKVVSQHFRFPTIPYIKRLENSKDQPPLTDVRGVIWNRELTMTYSHMGEPHYHWRIGVSLLSSGRDQVGPPSYYRQQRGIEKWVVLEVKYELYQARWISLLPTKPFRRCIVKPNEQLVLVSYTYHYASTPNLSTS